MYILKINLNLSSYKWTPYQIGLYIRELGFFFFFLFRKGILSCLFLHHRRYKLDHALETLQTTKVVDHTQWWTMMVVDVNAQKNYKAKRRGRSITMNVSDLVSPTLWHHDMTPLFTLERLSYYIHSLITFCVISLPWHQSNSLFYWNMIREQPRFQN